MRIQLKLSCQIILVLLMLKSYHGYAQDTVKVEGNLSVSGVVKINEPIEADDAVTKAYVDALKAQVMALQGIKDIDNNTYGFITIGTQIWMTENLATTRYNDGTTIPLITDNTAWSTAHTSGDPAYTWYNNAPSPYGALYNWYAIDVSSNGGKNVCPVGWHVPTETELDILIAYLDPSANGNINIAGGKMKAAGLAHWQHPNADATNESEFSGLPGGARSNTGTFSSIGTGGFWWNATGILNNNYFLSHTTPNLISDFTFKGKGYSVRCIKD